MFLHLSFDLLLCALYIVAGAAMKNRAFLAAGIFSAIFMTVAFYVFY